jgi:hypothetical protein
MNCKTVPAKLLAMAAAGALMLAACGETPTSSRDGQSPSGPSMHEGPNASPSAFPHVQDWGLGEGKPIGFNAVGSIDPNLGDKPTLIYLWNFGDGTTGSDRFTTHAYADNGDYRACLKVVDMHGALGIACVPVPIHNVNPTQGLLTHPDTVPEGVSFEISLDSATDAPADVAAGLQYSFFCGTGSWSSWSTAHNRTCPGLPDNGTYVIAGRVRDKDGGIATAKATVVVRNVPPDPCLFSITRIGRGWVDVNVCLLDVPADRRATIETYWGDGAEDTRTAVVGSTVTYGHRYAKGTYTITLLATDKDGGAKTMTLGLVVQ